VLLWVAVVVAEEVEVVLLLVVVSVAALVVQWVGEQMLQGASWCILCPLWCSKIAAVQATRPTPNS